MYKVSAPFKGKFLIIGVFKTKEQARQYVNLVGDSSYRIDKVSL